MSNRRAYALGRYKVGDANPDKLDVATYKRMELDPQVQAGIRVRELAILGKPPTFNYAPNDPRDADEVARGERMVRFLSWVWHGLRDGPDQFLRDLLTARRYGFAVVEKVWASTTLKDGTPVLRRSTHPDWAGMVWIEHVKLLPQSTMESSGIAADEHGNLLGVYQNLAPKDSATARISFEGPDLDRVLIYTANKQAGNLYGESDHKTAYEHWYAKRAAHTDRNLLLERLSGVPVGEYSDPAGQDALETALENIGPGAVLTLPTGSNVRLLDGWEGAVQGYHDSIQYDDHQILRAYLVPSLTVGGGVDEGGSFARAESNFDTFLLIVRQIQLELEGVIERGFVRPLIDANFGPQPVYPTFDFPELAEKDRSRLAQVWSTAIRDGYVDPAIDAGWLRQELGVPEPAPDGYTFRRPETGPTIVPGVSTRAGFAAQAATSDDASKPTRRVVDALESDLESRLTNAVRRFLTKTPDLVPTDASPDQLAKITIPPDWLVDAFTATTHRVLDDAWRVAADDYRSRGADPAALALEGTQQAHNSTLQAKGWLGRVKHRLAATTPSPGLEALNSYLAWASSANLLQSQRAAAELEQRLRFRVLQAYATDLSTDDVARLIADEFASYTTNQVKTIASTTIMDLYNSARNASMDAVGDFVAGIKFVVLEDNATTPFCRSIAGRSIAKSDPLYERVRNPPYWYNCRTVVVPVLGSDDHEFDDDWADWITSHAGVQGGGFVYGEA